MRTLEGNVIGKELKIGIVAARFNEFIVSKLIGGADAHVPVGGAGIAKMADALTLEHITLTRLGEDLLIEGRIRKD